MKDIYEIVIFTAGLKEVTKSWKNLFYSMPIKLLIIWILNEIVWNIDYSENIALCTKGS